MGLGKLSSVYEAIVSNIYHLWIIKENGLWQILEFCFAFCGNPWRKRKLRHQMIKACVIKSPQVQSYTASVIHMGDTFGTCSKFFCKLFFFFLFFFYHSYINRQLSVAVSSHSVFLMSKQNELGYYLFLFVLINVPYIPVYLCDDKWKKIQLI